MEEMTINLQENAVYVVNDGHLTKMLPIAHGEDRIVWNKGNVLDVVRSERIRLGNVEEIR